MAATEVVEQAVKGAYTPSGDTQFTTLTTAATDPTNKNVVNMSTGKTLVIWQNSDAVNAEWVTVDATDDAYGRATSITQQSIPASGWVMYLFEPKGWEQTLGGRNVQFDSESTDVKVMAIPV
jgi:hypothetical protein